ncbi:type I-E CRISPR-associated endoribonuclease Cas2e [Enterobacter sp.]|uniref:type I-E CRISPR-associated endoribonuclease Cas2e n=1 Tax=Enterobacter sp. TaxID=42895 RepID=UPI0029824A7E|nr:type I-E CRISPR-associated endoribonuclease Cas2e [Enterobacter sp.]
MKLWFVEPRANVFVSGVKDSVANTVVDYLLSHCRSRQAGLFLKARPIHPAMKSAQSVSRIKRYVKSPDCSWW